MNANRKYTSASLSRRAFLEGTSALSAAALWLHRKRIRWAQGGSSDTDSKFRTLDDIKKAGTVNIGSSATRLPFGYVDANGNYAGYDIVFAARHAARNMSVQDQLRTASGLEPRALSCSPIRRNIILANLR